MKKPCLLLSVLLSLLVFQCEDDDTDTTDFLEQTGLFGRWEIQDEVQNGNISDLLPKCCEFLEFDPDNDRSDRIGILIYTDDLSGENIGTFTVNLNNNTILFVDDENDEFVFEYAINDTQDLLSISFLAESTTFSQNGVRRD